MFYVTYGEGLSGVYAGQVIDVCRFITDHFGITIRLVAFISPRNFFKERRKMLALMPNAIVIPALPRVKTWSPNVVTLAALCLALRPAGIIARGVLAAQLAMWLRSLRFVKRVCYDGRGAVTAERREYFHESTKSLARYRQLEAAAVIRSDFRIAVSRSLLDYWRNEFGYNGTNHVIVPCTIESLKFNPSKNIQELESVRRSLGYQSTDVVLAYAGSTAGWQSFSLLREFLTQLLVEQADIRILMLCASEPQLDAFIATLPAKITRKYVASEDVPRFLAACDYGLLIRERSVTNLVASPVKVAEYLAAGLPVILSPGVGDYPEFVEQYKCGLVIKGTRVPELTRPAPADRKRIAELAESMLSKQAYSREYEMVIKTIAGRSEKF